MQKGAGEMFGGRKKQGESKELEKELLARQVMLDRYSQVFADITQKQSDTDERLDTLKKSQEKMDRQLTRVIDAVNCAADHTEEQRQKNHHIQEVVERISGGLEQSEDCYWKIVEELKQQQENMLETVEQNKHFTAPAEFLSKVSSELQEEMQEITSHMAELEDMGKQMGVLSLNAAIEAGRMGESGREFVAAAEDVRELAGQYQQITGSFQKAIETINEKLEETKAQVTHLNGLLKDNNVRMGKSTKEFSDSLYRMEHSDIQNFSPQVKKLQEELTGTVEKEEELVKQYALATDAMEQAGESFMKQQDALEQLKDGQQEIREQIKAAKLEAAGR